MKNSFKILAIASLISLSSNIFGAEVTTLKLTGNIEKNIFLYAHVSYSAKNKFMPGCGKTELNTDSEYVPSLNIYRDGNSRGNTFYPTIDEKGRYSLEIKYKKEKHGLCGWEINSMNIFWSDRPFRANTKDTLGRNAYEMDLTQANNSNIAGNFLDLTTLRCKMIPYRGNIANGLEPMCLNDFNQENYFLNNDYGTYRIQYFLTSFHYDIKNNDDQEVNIDFTLIE